MITLYDADRCPYCARVRIVLAEKGVEYEPVAIDLAARPAWLYEKNPLGKVPVLEEDGFVLPESAVIMEYLEERYPEPPLLPADAADRALARLAVELFDKTFGDDYYGLRGGDEDARPRVEARVAALDRQLLERPWLTGAAYGLADVAYLPWILRGRALLGIDVERFPSLSAWLERLAERPAVAAEIDTVAAFAR